MWRAKLPGIYPILFFLVLILCIITRFWHLDFIKETILDEVYFPVYGHDYLMGKHFFHVHPPLGNYIFTFSIWLYYHMPWVSGDMPANFDQVAVMSYRWINAVSGVILAVVAWGFAWALSKDRWFALLIFFFITIDGLLLVDSRVGMNNIYLVLFGLAALALAIRAHKEGANRRLLLILCGVFLGFTIGIKWNGLSYILMLIAFGLIFKFVNLCDTYRPASGVEYSPVFKNDLKLWEYVIYLIIIPLAVYCILWIPDRAFNTEYSFLGIHQQILSYHQGVKGDDHPYCAKWYTWPLMIRPMGYSFSTEVIAGKTYYRDIHLFANPILLWLSTLSVVVMCLHWLCLVGQWFKRGVCSEKMAIFTLILLGYFGNFLPWAFVSRCIFLYHYESAQVFATFALAWYLWKGLSQKTRWIQILSVIVFLAIVAGFIYWMPIMLGVSLSQSSFYDRMWFQSWI